MAAEVTEATRFGGDIENCCRSFRGETRILDLWKFLLAYLSLRYLISFCFLFASAKREHRWAPVLTILNIDDETIKEVGWSAARADELKKHYIGLDKMLIEFSNP